MNNKKISAVIPFYGDPADTLNLISQLQAQTMANDIEIIVSDDCSPDPFPQIEGVKVIRREKNGGFGANVNSGASQATGKWLFILNSDLSLDSDSVEKAYRKAESLGDVLLSPQVLDTAEGPQYVGRRFPRTFFFIWEWLTPLARFRQTKFWHAMVGHDLRCVDGATVNVDWLMGACMIIQTATFRRVSGMDERFFMNSEEIDLQRRLRNIGIPRIFAGDLTVRHIGGASSGGSLQRRQWVLNSRYIYAKKWNESQNLSGMLKAATNFNFLFNNVRQIRNKEVDARAIRKIELGLIQNAEKKR